MGGLLKNNQRSDSDSGKERWGKRTTLHIDEKPAWETFSVFFYGTKYNPSSSDLLTFTDGWGVMPFQEASWLSSKR